MACPSLANHVTIVLSNNPAIADFEMVTSPIVGQSLQFQKPLSPGLTEAFRLWILEGFSDPSD